MTAFFHSSGTVLELMDLWKSIWRGGASSFAASDKTLGLMPSGPGAFPLFRSLSSFSTFSVEMTRLDSSSLTLYIGGSGSGSSFSWVKTLWKNWFSRSAFSWSFLVFSPFGSFELNRALHYFSVFKFLTIMNLMLIELQLECDLMLQACRSFIGE